MDVTLICTPQDNAIDFWYDEHLSIHWKLSTRWAQLVGGGATFLHPLSFKISVFVSEVLI